MNDERDIEAALRASLAEHARRAPAAGPVVEHVLLAVERAAAPATRRAHQWGTWALPLIAAASVAAIAGALVGVAQLHRASGHRSPAAPISSVIATAPSPAPSVSSPPSAATSTAATANAVGLNHFRIIDMSFVGPEDGWALGTSDCLRQIGTCAAMVHTVDGAHWHSVTNPPGNVEGVNNCAAPCIASIRFANDQVGYAYGPSAFFMSTDAGKSWVPQRGGADALETLDGNVIRLVSDHGGCPGPCNLRVELAAIGTSNWTTVTLPGGTINIGSVLLARTGTRAFIDTHLGSGGSSLPSPLYASTDDGHTWAKLADPCASLAVTGAGQPAVSRDMTTAEDGSLSLLCSDGNSQAVTTSTDAGVHFATGARFALGNSGVAGSLSAATSNTLFVSAGGGIYRSIDRGRTWTRVIADASNGSSLCGFQNGSVGRCTSNDRGTIWTTRDVGISWSKFTFGQ